MGQGWNSQRDQSRCDANELEKINIPKMYTVPHRDQKLLARFKFAERCTNWPKKSTYDHLKWWHKNSTYHKVCTETESYKEFLGLFKTGHCTGKLCFIAHIHFLNYIPCIGKFYSGITNCHYFYFSLVKMSLNDTEKLRTLITFTQIKKNSASFPNFNNGNTKNKSLPMTIYILVYKAF